MGKSPSREANSHSASQETSRLLRNPKVHYRVHKSPVVVAVTVVVAAAAAVAVVVVVVTIILESIQKSWEAKSHSASQEISHLLWNPKVYYRIHKGRIGY
jgi:ABC-type Fe3+ transport system permease subunit